MSTLVEEFATEFHRLARARGGERVLVAVSGGVDSVVLLHLLRFTLRDLKLVLHVAHFDHAMRDDSAADAQWVRGLAAAWDLPCTAARGRGLRSEAAARHARYQFLAQVGRAVAADLIALGHHADDQVETVLFRLLRGTGVDGLAGIPARRGRIIRPLLPFARTRIEAYAREQGIGYRDDPTNRSRAYSRNRIRHEVLPQLEAEWPGSKKALLALSQSAAQARQGWNSLLAEIEERVVTAEDTGVIELARDPLLKYHPEVRGRLLRRLLARLNARPGRTGTAAATAFITSGASGAAMQVSGARIERVFDRIRLSAAERVELAPDQPLTIEKVGSGHGSATIGGRQVEVQWRVGACESDQDATATLRVHSAQFPLMVRGWRAGDRIQMSYGSKKLKKLFVEKRLGRPRRHSIPVIVDANDNVLCVPGLVRAATAAPDGGPVLCFTVNDGHSS